MKQIEEIVACIEKGGVALLPTDTVYGLAASPKHAKAVEKIYRLKGRPMTQFLPIMVANVSQLEDLGLDINENALKLLNSEFVPGALSLVLGFKNAKRKQWLAEREEVAIRIPDDKLLLQVLEKTGALLVTSANKHGNSNMQDSTDEIIRELNGSPDIVVKGGAQKDLPSTIINCRKPTPVIERLGNISAKQLDRLLKE